MSAESFNDQPCTFSESLSGEEAAIASACFFQGIRELRDMYDPQRLERQISLIVETPVEPVHVLLTNDSLLLASMYRSGTHVAYLPDGYGGIHAFSYESGTYKYGEDIIEAISYLRDQPAEDAVRLGSRSPDAAEIVDFFDWINDRT